MESVVLDAPAGFALFDTALGHCGIAWGPQGICGVQLPERDAASTRARLLRHAGRLPEGLPPESIRAAMREIAALLMCAPHDVSALVLDMRGLTEFQRRVYAITSAIAPGRTRTYGEIAIELGDRQLARAVGQALGANPFAPVVPCHRVLAAGQRPGGFSAHGGTGTKLRMLAAELAAFPAQGHRLL